MMAAVQPFITGAISKTINLPEDATVDDIAASYRLSWELGLKANALYRDGSKLSQPLSTKSETGEEERETDEEQAARAVEAALGGESTEAVEAAPAMQKSSISSGSPGTQTETVPAVIERVVERIVDRPLRRRLPDTRASLTHRFNVAGHEGYLTVGLYEDGGPGELFITMAKEGSTIGGLMDCLGTAISVALQYGVPIESLVNKFAHQRFEPMGMTTSADIPFAKSLVDYIFRWLGMEFVPGFREANMPKRPNPTGRPPEPPLERALTRQATRPTNGEPNGTSLPSSPASHEPAQAEVLHESLDNPGQTQAVRVSALSRSNANMMGDAPACDVCGSITVRNGNCYKCLNCGNSMGCS
jgi:ribonucleoside-diphosphate reductase alpha chain